MDPAIINGVFIVAGAVVAYGGRVAVAWIRKGAVNEAHELELERIKALKKMADAGQLQAMVTSHMETRIDAMEVAARSLFNEINEQLRAGRSFGIQPTPAEQYLAAGGFNDSQQRRRLSAPHHKIELESDDAVPDALEAEITPTDRHPNRR